MSSPEHKELIWNLIKNIKVGMLVTGEQHSEGLRARPMQLVQYAYDGTLYFFTSKKTAKVFEIKEDRDVCVTFSEPNDDVYVSMTGKARLSDDKELIDRYWNSHVAAWFENGKEDEDLGMLKVKINRGEHWNATSNKLVQLFEIAKANVLKSETPDLGENEKFGVE
jgi:general stress protein 26